MPSYESQLAARKEAYYANMSTTEPPADEYETNVPIEEENE